MKKDEKLEKNSFSKDQRANAHRRIDTYINNKELKEILGEFLEILFEKEYPHNVLSRTVVALNKFILILGSLSPSLVEMNWNNFCRQMHAVEKVGSPYRYLTRELFIDFYKHVAKGKSKKVVKVEINHFSHLMLDREIPRLRTGKVSREEMSSNNSELFDEFENKIRTNFPIGSQPEQIYQASIEQKNSIYTVNIYIRANELYLRNLLIDFVEYFKTIYKDSEQVIGGYNHRIFQYYFEKSLGEAGITINELNSFNFLTFMKQYNFFTNIKKEYENMVQSYQRGGILTVLVHFYVFINHLYRKKNENYLFPPKLLLNDYFIKALLKGYVPVYSNGHESTPKADKWIVLNDKNYKSAGYSLTNGYIDFSLVENKTFKQELKDFLWIREGKGDTVRHEATILIKFLNAAERYYRENKNIISFQTQNVRSYFTGEFLLKYQAALRLRKTSNGMNPAKATFNAEISPIRLYLRYYQTKYNIPDIALSQLKYSKIEYNGGNPMTPHDFKVIQNEFRECAYTDLDGELMFIIFQLTCTTKLRIGEVLLLQRDCINSIDHSLGIGEITYYSKTSRREKITEIFLKEDIELIQRAMVITEELVSKALQGYEKYIFLVRYPGKMGFSTLIKSRYSVYFRNIIEKLKDKDLLEKDYRAYDARDTFIDATWQAVEAVTLTL